MLKHLPFPLYRDSIIKHNVRVWRRTDSMESNHADKVKEGKYLLRASGTLEC